MTPSRRGNLVDPQPGGIRLFPSRGKFGCSPAGGIWLTPSMGEFGWPPAGWGILLTPAGENLVDPQQQRGIWLTSAGGLDIGWPITPNNSALFASSAVNLPSPIGRKTVSHGNYRAFTREARDGAIRCFARRHGLPGARFLRRRAGRQSAGRWADRRTRSRSAPSGRERWPN